MLKRCIMLLLTAAVVSGCSSARTSVSGSWDDDDFRSTKYSRILIVTLAADAEGRQQFNSALTRNLRDKGVEAWSILSLADSKTVVTRELVQELASDKQSEAVLVTRIVNQEVTAKEITEKKDSAVSRGTYSGDIYGDLSTGSTFNFVQVDYKPDIDAEDYIVPELSLGLSTTLYDVATEAPVYTIDSRAEKYTDTSKMINQLAGKIAGGISGAGLLAR